MLGISWNELLIIAVVALVVVGPKDLPYAMRLIGNWTGKLRRISHEFQGQFREALREAELDSVRQDIEAIGRKGSLADTERQLKHIDADLRRTPKDIPIQPGASGV